MSTNETKTMTTNSKSQRGGSGGAGAGAAATEKSENAWSEGTEDDPFGGPSGVVGIMIFSHVVVYALFLFLFDKAGGLPARGELASAYVFRIVAGLAGARPTVAGLALYGGFVALTALLAVVCPGIEVRGRPLPALGNKPLTYCCNGISVWYATLAILGILHATNCLSLAVWVDHFGSILTWSVVSADVTSVAVYLYCRATGTMERAHGNFLYDLFMGVSLNPRVTILPGWRPLDLKMWSELRLPWILLAILSLSCAAKQYEVSGVVSAPMALMVLAHLLYANACAKGDECVPTTWDIFFEKWGWMLIFWNFCGVPMAYCASSVYLLKWPERHGTTAPLAHSPLYTAACYALLLGAYYVWDTANSQKNHFRMQRAGSYIKRRTFPQLPWQTLAEPVRCLTTARGQLLITDGWYRYARKPHYTADILMAMAWGLICGFESFLPYWHVFFFTAMIIHRAIRDDRRCGQKYGADWETYTATVKYVFVPGLV